MVDDDGDSQALLATTTTVGGFLAGLRDAGYQERCQADQRDRQAGSNSRGVLDSLVGGCQRFIHREDT